MKMHVNHWEWVVASIGGDNDGVLTTELLEASQVPPTTVESMRRRGLLIDEGRGIDRLRDHPLTWRTRCRITLAAAGPGSALCRATAGRVHGCYSYRRRNEVEVVVLRGRDHRLAHGRVITSTWLPDEHITVVDGLPVTTLPRTFFDLCGHPDGKMRVSHPAHEKAMLRVYNDALARRGLTFRQEVAVLIVLAKRGRGGTRLVRLILLRCGPDHEPTQSETESLFAELMEAHGIRAPQRQVSMSDAQGWIGNVDFCWSDVKHIVEVDSRWHDGPIDQADDAIRDARLRAAGYTVARYRYGRMVADPTGVARELVAAIRRDVGQLPQV